MIIINGIGGSGSSFVIRALQRLNYSTPLSTKLNLAQRLLSCQRKLEKYPALLPMFKGILSHAGLHSSEYKVLMRPDTYWTDWNYQDSFTAYDPMAADFNRKLRGQKAYILANWQRRNAEVKLRPDDLSENSLPDLVHSYLNAMTEIEQEAGCSVILFASHWAEYGILKELATENSVYLIRDPFNSLISHSKDTRHGKDYRRQGLREINQREWIDNYLSGPHHYWLRYAQAALTHKNAAIVRYDCFTEDWKAVGCLPDITNDFCYTENNIKEILNEDSIRYIHSRTADLCSKIGFSSNSRHLI